MLVDHTTIFVRSGKGGNGCLSFRREKYIPKGGPDGGDGGRGGDCILVADPHLDTLLPLAHKPHQRAKNGHHGEGKQKIGADGDHKIIPVPVGTLVYDAETNELIADVNQPDDRIVIAKGGNGGFGNEHYKSATNQAPREWTEGGDWEERTLRLELKLIADIGLIGKPNAGKSTFLKAVSAANPRIADYPFTTLSPNLGIAALNAEQRLVIADIPGLIEGAADGVGLGHDFLRHVERTTLLLHLIDVLPIDGTDPIENHRAIRAELAAYAPELAAKPEIIMLNKIDLLADDHRDATIAELTASLAELASLNNESVQVFAASGATGEGKRAILLACWEGLQQKTSHNAGWRTSSSGEQKG